MPFVDLCLTGWSGSGGAAGVRLGEPLLDAYLEFVAARCRPNTVLATAFDLKVFFTMVAKPPAEVTSGDVLGFVTAQRSGADTATAVALVDGGGGGVSARTVRRRLSTVSGLFAFLQARGDMAANPVPRWLPTRRERSRPRQGVSLLRSARTLPKILSPDQVDALTCALRTHRDRAMVAAMVLGGLRRCEVLGLRMQDLRFGERRVFVAEGKGGHQRLIPVSGRFFTSVTDYLDGERPADATTDHVFVVLKGPRRGQPLSASGIDEVLDGARGRAGLDKATCHQLRHTCLTRLREAGMALEAIQAQGVCCIERSPVILTEDLSAGGAFGLLSDGLQRLRSWLLAPGDPPRRPADRRSYGQDHARRLNATVPCRPPSWCWSGCPCRPTARWTVARCRNPGRCGRPTAGRLPGWPPGRQAR